MIAEADALLRRALERSADAVALELRVVRSAATRWASATFAGARHEYALQLPGSAAAERWLARLPETDLPMRGHLVADLTPVAITRDADGLAVLLEILTVEDC